MTFNEAEAIATKAWRDWCAHAWTIERPVSEEYWEKWNALHSAWEQAWEVQKSCIGL